MWCLSECLLSVICLCFKCVVDPVYTALLMARSVRHLGLRKTGSYYQKTKYLKKKNIIVVLNEPQAIQFQTNSIRNVCNVFLVQCVTEIALYIFFN